MKLNLVVNNGCLSPKKKREKVDDMKIKDVYVTMTWDKEALRPSCKTKESWWSFLLPAPI